MTDQNTNTPGTVVIGTTIRKDEAANIIGTGVHTGLRKGTEEPSAHRLWEVISRADDKSWAEAAEYAFWGLRVMGYEIVKVTGPKPTEPLRILEGYKTQYKDLQHQLASPPPGWFTFGTHIDQPDVMLEFWGDEGGIPIWERPANV